MDPYETQNKKRKQTGILLLGAIAAVILAMIVYVASGSDTPQPQEGTDNTDTVSPSTPTPAPVQQSDSGQGALDILLDSGLSTEQISAAQAAAYGFASSNGKDIKKLSVDASKITQTQSINGSTYTFSLDFGDDKKYTAQLITEDLYSVRLYLTDPSTGKQVYDSKVIDYTGKVVGQ